MVSTSSKTKMANIPQRKILNIPLELCAEIRDALSEHGKVKVNGLGIFELRRIGERLGRNPVSGKVEMMKAYTKIKFRATHSLKEALC